MDQDEAMFGAEPKPKKKPSNDGKYKWISIGVVGSLFAVSHLGMIGHIVSRKDAPKLPNLNIPVGPYTSYKASVSEDGYAITYKANDPKTMHITTSIKEKAGFLGLANNTKEVVEEYVMDGITNQGGPVSNHRSWQDPATLGSQTNTQGDAVARSEACIKAIGSAEGTGRLVGTSVGASAAPALSNIPFIGWVAAGWMAMFSGNQGADIGGSMAEGLNENC